MAIRITAMTDAEAARLAAPAEDAGVGALRTERGNLPLQAIDVRADISGLTAHVELTQDFVNAFDVPLEASYVFPLPDRGAVTGMRMTADGHVVVAELQERAAARQAYDDAVAAGQRASIAEEDRPDVFTMRVGNILPGERVSVALTLVCPLPYEDGESTFRFPLVVAPRYIPGTALAGGAVGDGYAEDTDVVPDASRITPPVLLPGFPNPVRLGIDVGIDPAGLALSEIRSSLHAVTTDNGRIKIHPGERANRDFVLRLPYGSSEFTDSLILAPDADGDEGTYQLTVLPPISDAPPRPRDLVLVLDRSGSMAGWKMVAARRAAARIVDTLTTDDRFAVLTFDHGIERPAGLPEGLIEASDRNRYRAVEHLARVEARGGTELLKPLRQSLALLGESPSRDAVVVLVTDGQVGNDDQILHTLTADLQHVRVHTVGIDRAVNAGFLRRLAAAGGGRCELVESENRLDDAMDAIHRRIGAPLAHGLHLQAEGLQTVDDTTSPARLPDLFPGVPLVVTGRYRGDAAGSLTLRGTTRDGADWTATATGQRRDVSAVRAQWARAHLRDLEDRYAAASDWAGDQLEQRIVDTSLRFGVLCRFTAYVAIDSRVVADGDVRRRVLQPVEEPAGWEMASFAPSGLDYSLDADYSPAGVQCASIGFAAAAQPATRARLGRADLDRGGSHLGRLRDYLDGTVSPVSPIPPVSHPAPAVHRELAELAAAREQLRGEARRLRKADAATDEKRRELLADLARRLTVLIGELIAKNVPSSALSELTALVAAIETSGAVGPVWDATLQALDDFAGATGSTEKKRRAFWKRLRG